MILGIGRLMPKMARCLPWELLVHWWSLDVKL
jgi:hypothetical protein